MPQRFRDWLGCANPSAVDLATGSSPPLLVATARRFFSSFVFFKPARWALSPTPARPLQGDKEGLQGPEKMRKVAIARKWWRVFGDANLAYPFNAIPCFVHLVRRLGHEMWAHGIK